MALMSSEGWLFLLRWIHFLAGITWIGLLYYLNFVQVPFFAETEPGVRSGAQQKLLPRVMWWFRWGAMITFLSGWIYLLHYWLGIRGLNDPGTWKILLGGLLGSIMWANVWFVIWPAQQIIMASAAQQATGGQAIPEAAARGARGGAASRTNTLLSVPMLFFMGAASHFAFFTPTARPAKITMLVVLFVIMAIVEWNALTTTQWAGKKMLSTVKGTLWGGFVLAVIFFIALKLIFG